MQVPSANTLFALFSLCSLLRVLSLFSVVCPCFVGFGEGEQGVFHSFSFLHEVEKVTFDDEKVTQTNHVSQT